MFKTGNKARRDLYNALEAASIARSFAIGCYASEWKEAARAQIKYANQSRWVDKALVRNALARESVFPDSDRYQVRYGRGR